MTRTLEEFPVEVAAVLEGAATYIRVNGWHKGHFCPEFDDVEDYADGQVIDTIQTNHPPVCMVGGIVSVTGKFGGSFDKTSPEHAMMTYLNARSISEVPEWNDEEERTADEVIEALERAALLIRAGHIGDDEREYIFEPLPTTEPVKEPSPAPAPITAPKEPVPA